MSGVLQSRASVSGHAGAPAGLTNLDDFIPHPVARRRKPAKEQGGSEGLFDRLGVGLGGLLLLILVGCCIYAVQVSVRLTRLQKELADPNLPLPPATVSQLEHLAEDRVAQTLANAKMQIAMEVEKTTKELLVATLHDKTNAMAHKLRDDIQANFASSKVVTGLVDELMPLNQKADPGKAESKVPIIPRDLKFPDLKEWAEEETLKAVSNRNPPREKFYKGPLDLEDAITQRVKELEERWVAMGKTRETKPGFVISTWEKNPPWPFQKIRNSRNQEIGIILLSAPFVNDYYMGEQERGTFYRMLNTGHIMIGISSYEFFPAEIKNPADNRYVGRNPKDADIFKHFDGWLHCHRDPGGVLPAGVPRALISESDFTNPMRNDGGGVMIPQGYAKEYDFLYVNQGGAWNDYNRNFTLARKCLKKMAQMGLKVVILSKDVSKDSELAPYVKSGNLVVHKSELWRDFLKLIEKCRGLFTPCVSDASPRVSTEAMSFNVPLLMNYHIVGGWKYVNDKTGVFFHDENDLEAAITKLRSPEFQKGLSPRQWFIDTWGPYNSGLRLHAFLEIVVGRERLDAARRLRESRPKRSLRLR